MNLQKSLKTVLAYFVILTLTLIQHSHGIPFTLEYPIDPATGRPYTDAQLRDPLYWTQAKFNVPGSIGTGFVPFNVFHMGFTDPPDTEPPNFLSMCLCQDVRILLFIHAVAEYMVVSPLTSTLSININHLIMAPCGTNIRVGCGRAIQGDQAIISRNPNQADRFTDYSPVTRDGPVRDAFSCVGKRISGSISVRSGEVAGADIRCAVYWYHDRRGADFVHRENAGDFRLNPCIHFVPPTRLDFDNPVLNTVCTYGPSSCQQHTHDLVKNPPVCNCLPTRPDCTTAYDNCVVTEISPVGMPLGPKIPNPNFVDCSANPIAECTFDGGREEYYCKVDECSVPDGGDNFCNSRGTCSYDDDTRASSCECLPQFMGPRCEMSNACFLAEREGLQPCAHATPPGIVSCVNQDGGTFICGTSITRNLEVFPSGMTPSTTLAVETGDRCTDGWFGLHCDTENRCVTQSLCNSAICGASCCRVTSSVSRSVSAAPDYFEYPNQCECGTDFHGDMCQYMNQCHLCVRSRGFESCTEDRGRGPIDGICICHLGYTGVDCTDQNFCITTWNTPDVCGMGTCSPTLANDVNPFCNCFDNAILNIETPYPTCELSPCIAFRETQPCNAAGTLTESNGFNSVYPDPTNKADFVCCNCIQVPGEIWIGERCETRDRCNEHFPCQSGSTCTNDDSTKGYNCQCVPERRGDNCEILDLCIQDPGRCNMPSPGFPVPDNICNFLGSGAFKCTCGDLWYHDTSVITVDDNCFKPRLCTVASCDIEGTLSRDELPDRCRCNCREDLFYLSNLHGMNPDCSLQDACAVIFNKCDFANTASCTYLDGDRSVAVCNCNSGYYHGNGTEERCGFEDMCFNLGNRAACFNNGECVPLDSTFTCNCDPFYYPVGVCMYLDACAAPATPPCRNGGICLRDRDTYSCNCAPGYPLELSVNCEFRQPCHPVFAAELNPPQCQRGRCSRVNDFQLSCDCSGTGYVGGLCQCRQTVVRLPYPNSGSINTGDEQLLIFIVDVLGDSPVFRVDMGDGFKFEFHQQNLKLLSDTEGIDSVLTERGRSFLRGLSDRSLQYFAFLHTFREVRTHRVTTQVFNVCPDDLLHTYNPPLVNVYSAVQGRCLPELKLRNCAHDSDKALYVPVYERKSRFVITTSYYSNCGPDVNFKFRWKLYSLTEKHPFPQPTNTWKALDDTVSQISEHVQNDERHIVFLPRKLVRGDYWIEIVVYTTDPFGKIDGEWKADWCYFSVENSQPLAVIKGGRQRTEHYHAGDNPPITIDASGSLDLSDLAQSHQLKFNWHWRFRDEPSTVKKSCTILSSDCKGSDSVINVQLQPNLEYIFSVDVTSERPGESSLTSTATQEIRIIPDGLRITAECQKNCERFNPGDRVLIRCGCDDSDCAGGGVTYSYEGVGTGGIDGTVTETTVRGEYVVTLGQGLADPEPTYRPFTCNGELDDGHGHHSGSSNFDIRINKPPRDGFCRIKSPSVDYRRVRAGNSPIHSYEFLKDDLAFDCRDFKDPEQHYPLTYEVNAKIVGSSDELLPLGILIFYDVYPIGVDILLPLGSRANFTSLAFPAFSKDREFEVEVSFAVSDFNGLQQQPPLTEAVEVLDPLPTTVNPPTFLPEHLELGISEVIERIFGSDGVDGLAGIKSKGGDHQGALQLVLSFLYSRKENDLIRKVTPLPVLSKLGDVIGEIISRVVLHSHLIVKQVLQSLYLYSELVGALSNDALKNCAEQLIHAARYFRKYVVENEEVIFTNDILLLARAAKHAAELVMDESKKRGDAVIEDENLKDKTSYELNLYHLYRVDRDYFLEEDEVFRTDYNSSRDEDVAYLQLGDQIHVLSSICQKAYQSILDLMLAVAEREVFGSLDLPDTAPQLQKVFAGVRLQRVEGITQSIDFTAGEGSKGVITIPVEASQLISQQIDDEDGTQDIQVHVIETFIDPYFGDIANSVKTAVVSMTIKNAKLVKNNDQWIRIRENLTQPVIVKLPIDADIVDKTIDAAQPILAKVRLIPIEEMDHSNRDVKIHHLQLIHGSRFYVQVTTMEEDPNFKNVEYMVAVVKDYRPNINDFCSKDEVNTVRLHGDGLEMAVFTAEADAPGGKQSAEDDGSTPDVEYIDYYVGIWPFDETGTNELYTEVNYVVKFVQLSCLTRNEDENEWTGKGCEVMDLSETPGADQFLVCSCDHLSIFAGSILVPPNQIDFFSDIDFGLEIQTNWIVLVTVCGILVLYGICHFICLYLDRRDKLDHVGLTIMCDVGENFHHSFYLVNVVTGSRISSGTTASVSMRIYGSKGRSQAYVLKDPTLNVLNRGGNDSFLISSHLHLGELEKIRIWHDNTGSRPGWYLRKIVVREIKTDKEWYFFCGNWFSVTYEKDPGIIRTLYAATEAEKKAWKRRFSDRLVDEFNNSHLWFSVFFRLPTSNFTRCQRLVCSVGILTSFLLINILWHGYPANDYSQLFEVGGVEINLLQAWIALLVSALSLPFGIILIALFQRIRKRRIPTVVIWKNRTKHLGEVDFNESYLFGPEGPEKHIVPVKVGRLEGEEENTVSFAFPDTNPALIEAWVLKDTRGHGLRPTTQREPDAFVHKMDETGDAKEGNHLIIIGRHAMAARVREEDPSSFIYEGHDNFEDMFDPDLAARVQQSQHPWTRYKARDIQAIESELKKELPKVDPVIVVESDGKEHEILYDGIAIEVYEMRPETKKCCYLPWQFIWISWTIALLTILATCCLTIFAGLQIGPIRSLLWLTEVSLSFIQSILITQPLRIVIVGFFMSLIFRKLHATDEDRFQILIKDGDEDIGQHKKLDIKQFRPARSIPPLTGAAIFALRVRARKRNELKRGIYSIVVHLIVMFFIYFVALSNRNDQMYEVSSHLRQMLDLRTEFDNCEHCDNEFSNIKNQTQIYDYLTTVFVDAVNPRFDYNAMPIPPPKDIKYDSALMHDNETMLIGIPRLRQVRIFPHECNIDEEVKKYFLGNNYNPLDPRIQNSTGKFNCTGHYVIHHEDTATYNPFWNPIIKNKRSWSSRNNDVWSYKTPNETKSVRVKAQLATYEAGGYVAELGMEYRKTIGVLNYLRQTQWLDIYTRGLFVEMTAVVPNVNIFVDILLTIERSPSRAYTTSSQIYPIKLTFNEDEELSQKWIRFCYCGICFFLVGLSILLVKNIVHSWRHHRSGALKQMGLWIDFLIIVSCTVSILVALQLFLETGLAKERLQEAVVNEFVSLQEVAYWDFLHTTSFAATLSLCIIKLWKLLVSAFERFYILSLTLRLTAGYLLGFLFLVSLLTTAFAFWGVLEFGSSIEQFHSLPHAFLELMNQLLNPTFYRDLHAVHSIVGPIYFLIFGFTICLVGLNLFVALLTHGYYEAKEIARQRGPMLTYWSYIRRWKWYIRLFVWNKKKDDPNDKLILNPLRLKEMERVTTTFLRQVTRDHHFTRMNEIRDYANNVMLKGTGLKMISKADKRKQTRESMNTTLHVSEQRMEDMRAVTVAFLRKALQRDLTREQTKEYSRFNLVILTAKLTKMREIIGKVTKNFTNLMAFEDELNRRNRVKAAEKKRLEEERLQKEAERKAKKKAARAGPNVDPGRNRGDSNVEGHNRVAEPAGEPHERPPSWRKPSAASTSSSWRSMGSGRLPMTNEEYLKRKEELEKQA